MTDAEFLRRIDGHMAQSKEHMARGNELMSEIRVELEKNREERADFRSFIRDITRRNEHVMRGLANEVRGLQAETSAGTRVLVDLHEESKAQRGAILSLIDELRRYGLGPRRT